MYATPKNKPRRIVESHRPGPGMQSRQYHLYTVQDWPKDEVWEMIRLLKRHETAIAAVPDKRAAESLRKKCKKEADRFWHRVEMTKPRLRKKFRAPRNTSSPLKEPIKEYIGRLVSIDKATLRLLKNYPLAKWPRFYVDFFLKESAALSSLIKQAAAQAKIHGKV